MESIPLSDAAPVVMAAEPVAAVDVPVSVQPVKTRVRLASESGAGEKNA